MMVKANILIVDDEPIERQTLSDILRLEDYHVDAVSNGEAALDFLRLNTVDLMILDLRMPGMSGIEVIKVVNRTEPDVEIIMLTAHGSLESAIEALRNRVHDYLLKPAAPTQIIESVGRGLARRAARMASRGVERTEQELESHPVIALEDGTVIDFGRRIVRAGSKTIFLTPAEGRLLRILSENPGKVFSHKELVLLVQGYTASPQEAPEILRPLVSRLRQKLAPMPFLADKIISVRGTGYVFDR
jgi:DNA-binding response OmpR family regulator